MQGKEKKISPVGIVHRNEKVRKGGLRTVGSAQTWVVV
jgi:hypothetical protein